METPLVSALLPPPLIGHDNDCHGNGCHGSWVEPVTATKHIVVNPRAWVDRTVAIAASFYPPVRQQDGTWLATTYSSVRVPAGAYVRGKHSLDIQLSPDAHAYYLRRMELHAPAIYRGEVKLISSDGTYRLFLYEGLTTARHRPACSADGKSAPASPPLKACP